MDTANRIRVSRPKRRVIRPFCFLFCMFDVWCRCFVFSEGGRQSYVYRDIPNMLSGGDVDGDKYWVLWDPDIIQPLYKLWREGQYPKPSLAHCRSIVIPPEEPAVSMAGAATAPEIDRESCPNDEEIEEREDKKANCVEAQKLPAWTETGVGSTGKKENRRGEQEKEEDEEKEEEKTIERGVSGEANEGGRKRGVERSQRHQARSPVRAAAPLYSAGSPVSDKTCRIVSPALTCPKTSFWNDRQFARMVESFITMQKSSVLGRVSRAHKRMAHRPDVYNAKFSPKASHPKCLQLAELATRAVDAPKTGETVVLPAELMCYDIPHFMAKSKASREATLPHSVYFAGHSSFFLLETLLAKTSLYSTDRSRREMLHHL